MLLRVGVPGPAGDQSVRVTLVLDCAGGQPCGVGADMLISAVWARLG
jgi:hypothetical protein